MSQSGILNNAVMPPGSGVQTLTGDTGGTVGPDGANNIDILGSTNINTVGNPGAHSITINLNNSILLPNSSADQSQGVISLGGTSFMHDFGGSGCTFLGQSAGNFTGSGVGNTGIGENAAQSLSTGQLNTSIGSNSLSNATTSSSNVGVGSNALNLITTTPGGNVAVGYFAAGRLTGSQNVAIGGLCLGNATGAAANNVCVGYTAGDNYLTNESSNIIFGENTGTTGESNVMRLGGGTGSGNGQQNACYISGINGSSITPTAYVVINGSDQLSTLAANLVFAYTSVSTTPYTVLGADYYLSVNTSSIAITIQLPNAPTTKRTFVIKDRTGNAAANNITVTTAGGAVNIDGATSYIMNTNYQSIQLIFNGSTYEVY